MAAPWRAVTVVAVALVLPLLLSGELTAAETADRSRADDLAKATLVARQAARIVGDHVLTLRNQVATAYNRPDLREAVVDSPQLRVELRGFRDLMGDDVQRLYLLSGSGTVSITPPEELAGRTPASSVHIDRTVTDTVPVVSAVFFLPPKDPPRPTLLVHTQFRDFSQPAVVPAGRWLVAEIDLTRARQWLAPLRESVDELYMIDRDGRFVLSTTRPALGPADISGDPLVSRARSGIAGASVAPDPLGGGTRLVAIAPIPELGWQVVGLRAAVGVPPEVESALAQARLLRLILAIGLLAGTFAFASGAAAIADQRRSLGDANERLATTNAELADATAAKSRFLANMSHDLRTPLNAIIGFSDVLIQGMFGELNAKQHEYVTDIRDAGRHQLDLVNDILDLSKVEAGKMELRPQDLDLADLLRGVNDLLTPLANGKAVELQLEVDPALGEIRHDPARLRQVVLNLLSNAVKFTPSGGVVRTSAAPRGDGAFRLAVRDTGVGIAPQDQAVVFEDFRQVGGADQTQGTGLGLALVKRFVEAMGGSISIESILGQGSTFTIELPLRQADPVDPPIVR